MTSATLSVGLNTTAAKTALQALRADMEKLGGEVKLTLTPTLSTSSMQRDLDAALGRSFAKTYKVLIDGRALSDQISAAVKQGLSGAKLNVGVTGAAPAAQTGLVPDFSQVLATRLQPAVDELAKAAALVAGVARQAGISGGSARGSEGQSFKDPVTGVSTSYKKSIDPSVALSTVAAGNTDLRAQRLQELNEFGERAELFRQRRRQAAGDELRDVTERQTQLRQIRAQAAGDELNEIGQRQRQLRSARAQSAGDELNEAGSRAEALRRRRAQDTGDELNDLGQRQNQLRSLRAQAASQVLNETGERQSQIQQRRRERDDELNDVRRHYERLKLAAAQQYSGRGSAIAAASGISAQYGPGLASAALGPRQSFLLEETGNLEKYRRQVKGLEDDHRKVVPAADLSAAAQRRLTSVMNEGHSAARGLAGSMGALWTTYGSLVPLVAAAAIGASLRSVFTVGKEVEYQLAFVSALSDNAAVSISNFSQALKGSQAGPVAAAEGMRGLAQNGLSVSESLQALPGILALATTGEMELSQAALGATGVMAAFNLTVNDLGRVGDVFAKAAAISNTSVQGMVESMKQASTVGDQFHVSLEETAASLAIMAQRNITGTAAGTAFRNMMTELAAPSKKAREAMAQLHLEIYDGNKQLLPYEESLGRLRNTVLLLDEKSKDQFLGDMFGERGAKAVNALLSDFDTFGVKLDEIKNKSKGFNEEVVATLGDTTAGKLKKLFSEFEVSATTAFDRASGSVGGFVDSLRLIVGSTDFQETLTSLVNGVLSLTRYLEENAKSIAYVAAAWLGFKVLDGVITALAALRVALIATEGATIAFGVAAQTALGWATGGVSLLVALGAQYLLTRDNSDAATVATDNYTKSLTLQNQDSDARIKKMMSENDVLARQVELQWQGVSAINARKQAEGEVVTRQTNDISADLAENKRKLALNKTALERAIPETLQIDGFNAGTVDSPETATLRREGEKLQTAVNEGQRAIDNARALARENDARDKTSTALSLTTAIERFNSDLAARKKLKASISVEAISLDWAKSQPEQVVRDEIAKRNAEFNRNQANSYTTPTSKGSNRLNNAIAKDELEQLRESETRLKDDLKFRKELDDAKYSTEKFGPYMASIAAEIRAEQASIEAINQQADAIDTLTKLKRLAKDPADVQRYTTEINKREESIQSMRRELEWEKAIYAVKAQNRADDQRDVDSRNLKDLGDKDARRVQDIYKKYSTKVQDPGVSARIEAELATELEYRDKIFDSENRVAKLERGRKQALEDVVQASVDQVAAKSEIYSAAQAQLSVETDVLNTLKAQRDSAKASAGGMASAEYARSQTAQYGFDKFWEQYKTSAESAADSVFNIMKTTTDGMGEMVAHFSTTGKLNFKSFAASVAAETAKMATNKAFLSLFQLGLNFFSPGAGAVSGGGGISLGGVSAGSAAGSSSIYSLTSSANGNVMTDNGPMPLRRYSAGGVTTGRQFSEIGEGAVPEAYVPLHDGRSIPVTVKGASGGSTSVQMGDIHIHGDSSSGVKSDSSAQKANQAKQLADMIEVQTTQLIIREKRPGGILYSA